MHPTKSSEAILKVLDIQFFLLNWVVWNKEKKGTVSRQLLRILRVAAELTYPEIGDSNLKGSLRTFKCECVMESLLFSY